MPTDITRIPAASRRRLALTCGLFATLFCVVGIVALSGSGGAVINVFAVLVLLAAVALALMCWGVLASLRHERGEQAVDALLTRELAASGQGGGCGCGHQHDPDELHITDAADPAPDPTLVRADDPCAHDGTGSLCTHSCETCVLAALRPSTS